MFLTLIAALLAADQAPMPTYAPATPEQLGMKVTPAPQAVNTQTALGKLHVTCSRSGIATITIGKQIVGHSKNCTSDMPGVTHARTFGNGEQVILVQTATGWLANGAAIHIAPKQPAKVIYFSALSEFTGIKAVDRIGYAGQSDGAAFACEATLDWQHARIASSRGGNRCGR